MDPLTFPVLAGTVLTGAVNFLFNRANAVLDRRAGRISVDEPEQPSAQSDELQVQADELTDARIERITQAKGAISVYASRPELLRGEDDELRMVLGQLRADLEAIYGRGLPFGEEHRPEPGVEVSQRAEDVRNSQVGVRAHGITESARVRVDQEATTIQESGEQVGIELDGRIG